MAALNRFRWSLACSVVALAASGSAHAQIGPAASDPAAIEPAATTEDIVVTGIRGSLRSARNIKRDSAGIVDAIAAQDIGKLPDTNLAESLQRITGVSISRAGGEGSKITVRGFGPEFNTVLVDGRQIASEDDTRAFAFDTIASELVSGIEVYKSSTARLQSGGVGATVNISTARPLRNPGLHISGGVSATYDQNSEKATPNATLQVSDTFADDMFGVLLNVTYQRRKTRLDSANTDGWLENLAIPQSEINGGAGYNGNIFSPRNFDQRATSEDRERIGGVLVLQYRPSDDLTLTANGLYSKFNNVTNHTGFGHWFTGPNLTDLKVDTNGTVIDATQGLLRDGSSAGMATDFHSKKFDRLTETYDLGGNIEWKPSDRLSVVVDGHYSRAQRFANNGRGNQLSLIGYLNRVRFQSDDKILPFTSGFDTASPAVFSGQQTLDGSDKLPGTSPAGVSNYLDPANNKAHVMLRRGFAIDDKVAQLRSDLTWTGDNPNSGLTKINFGIYYSRETKAIDRITNEVNGVHCTFCGYPDAPQVPAGTLSVYDAGNNYLSGVPGSERLFAKWLAHDGEAFFKYLESVSGKSFDALRADDSYRVKERVVGGYIEANFAGEFLERPILLVAGARFEQTSSSVTGTDSPVRGLIILDKTELQAQRGVAVPVASGTKYEDVLPNMSLKWDASDNLTVRFAASQTLTRPTLQDLSPVLVLTTTRQGGNLTAFSGNPALKPFKSSNLDLSFEYYYGQGNYISLGVFYKNVNNFIVKNQFRETIMDAAGGILTDPSQNNAPAVFTITRPVNGEAARIVGIEAAIQQSFGETGFGIQLNGTLVRGNKSLNPADLTQKFALTGLSNSANAVIYYDKGIVEARVAWNWRAGFLESLTQQNGDGVTNVRAFSQFDASAAVEVLANVKVFIEGINLTNEKLLKFGRFENQFLLAEDSGRRFNFGVRASF